MFTKYLLIVLLFNGVLSDGPDECVRYIFEDYDELFTRDVPMCNSLPSWNLGTYDNSTITAPNENSKWFIEPSSSGTVTCTASFNFTITPNAILEANVYFETSTSDIVYIDLMQITETGTHLLVGWQSVTEASGWRAIRVTNTITLTGNPPFQGYVRFLGQASSNSVMIVDSFRYVPLSMDPEEECILYEDSTTKPTPTTTPTTTTPTATPITEECLRYIFEDYDDLFTRDVRQCIGAPSWNLGTYYNSTIVAPNENSKWFIQAPSPSMGFVCTASFNFTLIPGAIAEINVYLETAPSDILLVDLFQLTESGVLRSLGWTHIAGVTGWQVMRVTNTNTITGNPPFQGYMTFLGVTSAINSVMIIDSFRYIPSSMDPEEECILYEDITTTVTDTPTPDTTPTTPIITPPENLTNYVVKEIFDFQKSIRISKKRITMVGNFDGVEPPLLDEFDGVEPSLLDEFDGVEPPLLDEFDGVEPPLLD